MFARVTLFHATSSRACVPATVRKAPLQPSKRGDQKGGFNGAIGEEEVQEDAPCAHMYTYAPLGAVGC